MANDNGPPPERIENLTPKKIVTELDRFIIGQHDAKKAVAVAMRNRYRRDKLPADLREEVIPKNILMIGPTGVGKTEIARRLAKLVDAPFLKIEATKYTEVGYVGRDVESMIRDLVEIAVRMVGVARFEAVKPKAEEMAIDRILSILKPRGKKEAAPSPLSMIFGTMPAGSPAPAEDEDPETQKRAKSEREVMRKKLVAGELDDKFVEIEVEESLSSVIEVFSGTGMEEMGVNFQDLLGGLLPKKKKRRSVRIGEARKVLAHEEAKKLIDMEDVKREAISKVEEYGIVFIDELDKIAGKEKGFGPDVSREGVQRDILPIVEGSTVITKYGPVRTDHILFMAAGAFHLSKPSDLIPELQGRFPIRVELSNLSREDFKRILVEPQNALVKQYVALLSTEAVEVTFTDDAIDEIARLAQVVNEQTENIGARRLHTILEKVLEEISFEAPDVEPKITIDREYVRKKLETIVKNEDLSRFIL